MHVRCQLYSMYIRQSRYYYVLAYSVRACVCCTITQADCWLLASHSTSVGIGIVLAYASSSYGSAYCASYCAATALSTVVCMHRYCTSLPARHALLLLLLLLPSSSSSSSCHPVSSACCCSCSCMRAYVDVSVNWNQCSHRKG